MFARGAETLVGRTTALEAAVLTGAFKLELGPRETLAVLEEGLDAEVEDGLLVDLPVGGGISIFPGVLIL